MSEETTISVVDVLNEVSEAFESGLIDCADKDSPERRIEVVMLRKRVKRAINQARIDEAISGHGEPSGFGRFR